MSLKGLSNTTNNGTFVFFIIGMSIKIVKSIVLNNSQVNIVYAHIKVPQDSSFNSWILCQTIFVLSFGGIKDTEILVCV